MSHLWLSLSIIIYSHSIYDLRTDFHISLYIFFAVLCKVMFSIQINDLSDREKDGAAGKKRWISTLPHFMGVFLSLLIIAAGIIVIFLASGSVSVIISYAATILLAMAYSLRPLRFKERGISGIITYAAAATVIYVVVPWAWLGSNPFLLLFLILAVFSDKWVQLHFHQIVDHDADLKTEIKTYAARAGLKRARASLQIAALAASLSMIGLLFYFLFFLQGGASIRGIILAIAAAIIAASGIYARKIKNSSALIQELPWIYLGLTYLIFCVLPPVIFAYLALKEPLIWVLMALSTLSFLGISRHSIRYKYE